MPWTCDGCGVEHEKVHVVKSEVYCSSCWEERATRRVEEGRANAEEAMVSLKTGLLKLRERLADGST